MKPIKTILLSSKEIWVMMDDIASEKSENDFCYILHKPWASVIDNILFIIQLSNSIKSHETH